MNFRVVSLGMLALLAGCSRTFAPPLAPDSGATPSAPTLTSPAVVPAVVSAGQTVAITFRADQKLLDCAAQVAGQSASCGAPSGDGATDCACTFLALATLPEGPLSVVGQGRSASGTGTASSTLEFDKTAPEIGDGFVVQRGALGQPDRLVLEGSPVSDPPPAYAGQAVVAVKVWDAQSGGTPLATLDLAHGESAVALGTAQQGPRHVWVSAIDLPGNESARALVTAGDDQAGPTLSDGGAWIVRNPLGTADQVQVSSTTSSGCAVSTFAVYGEDGGQVVEIAASSDGGTSAADVGAGDWSYARLFVAARDRCGVEGPRAEALGADLTGPAIDGSKLTWSRRPMGVAQAIRGGAGAVVDGQSAVVEVRAFDGAWPDGGLVARFGVDATGGFGDQDAGARPLERVWLEATDKCGNVSGQRVYPRNVDAVLNAAGRTAYDDAVSPVALYAFGSPFDPREMTAGPGVAAAWTEELADAGALAAIDGLGLQTSALAQAGKSTAWTKMQPGLPAGSRLDANTYAAPPAIYFDAVRGHPVLLEEFPSTFDTATAAPVAAWERVNERWVALRPTGLAPQSSVQDAIVATWDPTIGKALVVTCSGSSTTSTSTFDGATWSRLPVPAVPCDHRGLALAYDAMLGTSVLITYDSSNNYFPVTTYTLGGNGWTALPTPTRPATGFSSGNWAGDLALAYDGVRGQLELFTSAGPGVDAQGNPVQQNTWIFSGSDWQLAPTTSGPPVRAQAAFYFDSSLGKAVLFGGLGATQSANPTLGDTWLFDGTSWQLWAAPGGSAQPSPRFNAAATFDVAAGQSVVFGGGHLRAGDFVADKLDTDTWSFTSSGWARLDDLNPAPPARLEHNLVYDPRLGASVLYGGYDPNVGSIYGDTWSFDGSNWTQLAADGSGPPARYGTAMAYDSRRGQLVLFGGGDASGPRDDTWIFDGATWTPLATAHTPPKRFEHALAYDAARDRVVLYGGWSGGFYLSDTWEFDGSDWSQVVTSHSPSGRHNHGLAYDPLRGKTILVGGATALGDIGDRWEWDGSTWTQVAQVPAFSQIVSQWTAVQGMAFALIPDWLFPPGAGNLGAVEPAPGLLAMFGGWYDKSSFGQQAPPSVGDGPWLLFDDGWRTPPPAQQFNTIAGPYRRTYSSWTFDSSSAQMVLFGGAVPPPSGGSQSDPLNSLKADDATWLFASEAPHARTAAHLATIALPRGASLQQLQFSYLGSGSGDSVGDGGTPAPLQRVDLLAWSALDGGGWTTLAPLADGGLVPAADPDGGYASYLSGDRLFFLAAAPPSSAPGTPGGLPSVLSTDYLEVHAAYALPAPEVDGGP